MTIYIASPYRAPTIAQFEKQLAYTKELARATVATGHDVIVPHLYYPEFLDDNETEERIAGMKSALRLLQKCDVLLVGTKLGISEGMAKELEWAEATRMKVRKVNESYEIADKLEELDDIKAYAKRAAKIFSKPNEVYIPSFELEP